MVDKNANRHRVYLRIVSDLISADEIAARMGISPNETWHKGDDRARNPVPQKVNGCTLESGCDESVDWEAQLAALIKRISGHEGDIRELSKQCEVAFVCVLYANCAEGFVFSSENMLKIADCRARFEVDVYPLDE